MSQTVVLFWLSVATSARGGVGATAGAEISPSQRADALAWASSQGVVLEAERPNVPSVALPGKNYDPTLVARIEAWLDQARSAAVALEESSALELLSQVETSLRDHPELPQAAWLRAEHHHVLADVRGQSPAGAALATELRGQAELLEGPRSLAFNDQTGAAAPAAPARFPITVLGVDPRDRVEWNGQRVSGPLSIGAGEHHVRVLRGGRLIHAAWTTIAEGATSVTLALPPIAPCSNDDLAGVRIDDRKAVAEPGTRCQSWAVARAAPQGGIEVARCVRNQCGPLVHFERPKPVARDSKPVTPERRWSKWSSYTLLGVGVLATTGVVLWQLGVFDKGEQQLRTTWEFQGLQEPTFRF